MKSPTQTPPPSEKEDRPIPRLAPDIAAVVEILAAGRARRMAAEAQGGSRAQRADDLTSPRDTRSKGGARDLPLAI